MTSKATTPEQYIKEVKPEHKEAVVKLRETILKNLPKGFKEVISYGMIGYVVPQDIYPPGYHCNPKLPLGFANIASQKNYIALHHMGLYANPQLLTWFTTEYPKHSSVKLDIGKGCIRFKKVENIPYKLIGELMKKLSVDDWIKIYEKNFLKR
jgi:uncharacterized protein YdhG (YjbR/CyaY superfamily)